MLPPHGNRPATSTRHLLSPPRTPQPRNSRRPRHRSSYSYSVWTRLAWTLCLLVGTGLCLGALCDTAQAEEPAAASRQRLLLLYQKPDGHPVNTHEYLRGLTRLKELLAVSPQLDVRLVPADEPWTDGPELLDAADGAVLFLAQGALWMSANPERLRAFQRLAERGGGLSCLHWAMGSKPTPAIPAFVDLLGGCHGGDDRRFRVLETTLRPVVAPHDITRGLEPVRLKEEFYYDLKWPKGKSRPQPLMEAAIDDLWWPVAWAWERPDGGRSFGFSGLHFDENWNQPTYQKLVTRGVLWTMKQPLDKLP